MTSGSPIESESVEFWKQLLEYSAKRNGERSVVRSKLRAHRFELDEHLGGLSDFLAEHRSGNNYELARDLFNEVALLLVNERGDWQQIIESVVSSCGKKGFAFVDFLSLANRLAWETRGGTLPDSALDVRVGNDPDLLMRGFRLLILLEQRRFVFDQPGMRELLRERKPEEVGLPNDLIDAFRLHTKIVLNLNGENGETPAEHVKTAISLCSRLAHTDGPRDPTASVVCDVLAQAVWLGYRLENQGGSLLEICESWEYINGNSQALIKFRKAAGYRLSGNFDDAIKSIDEALQLVRDNSGYGEVFVEQCLREREICTSQRSFQQQLASAKGDLQNATKGFEGSLNRTKETFQEEMRELEKSSLTRTIEIVTLFSSAVAFVLSTVQMAGKVSNSAADVAPLIILIGTGLASFAGLIVVLMVWSSRRKPEVRTPGSARELGLVVALVAAIVFLQGMIGTWVVREIPSGGGGSPASTTVAESTDSSP